MIKKHNIFLEKLFVIVKYIDKILSFFSIVFIKIYQYTLSPDKGLPSLWLKGRVCMHEPHCSQYGVDTFKRHGFGKGVFKVADRVLHCTGGYDKIYDPAHYRVVFFSSAPIGVPFLEAIAQDKRFELVGVVTNPDQPVGRGLEMQENIIKKIAKELFKNDEDYKIKTPIKINPGKSEDGKNFATRLEDLKPDYFVVIAYGKIMPKTILDIAKVAPINVHGSILPKYRGASPIQSVLLEKEKETGITIMKMAEGMDTGDMIDIARFKIPFDRTTLDIIEKMKSDGPRFLCNTLWKYGKRILGEVKQDDDKATYCKKMEKEDGLINPFKDTVEDIYSKFRAYFLRPKIYFIMDETFGHHQGKRVIIEKLQIDEKEFEQNKKSPLREGRRLNNAIKEIIIKPEGKKSMTRESFLQGYMK